MEVYTNTSNFYKLENRPTMKYCFAVFAIFCALQTMAQLPTHEYNEEIYSVYPSRQYGIFTMGMHFPIYQKEWDFFDDDGNAMSPVEADIIPCFDSLPDGKYLVFAPKGFKSFHLFKLKRGFSKKDTTFVTISFTLSKGKKNGLARWYGHKGVVLMEGDFLNDDKNGEWKVYDYEGNHIRTTNFHKGLREGKDIFFKDADTVAVTHYISDIMDGEIKVFYKDRLAMIGQVEDAEEVGKWIYYHPNGKLASRYTYGDSVGEQLLPFLYRTDLVRAYQHKNFRSTLVDKKVRNQTKLDDDDLYDSLGITDFQIYYQTPSMYEGKYEIFNYDGKPSDIREFKGGFLIFEPKRYDYQGRILEEVILDVKHDSLIYAHHIKNSYGYGRGAGYYSWGTRFYEEHYYWRNRSVLNSVQHRRATKKQIKKGTAKEYVEYHFFTEYFDLIKNRDTTVITDFVVRDDVDTVSIKRIHLGTGYVFIEGNDELTETFNKKRVLTHTRKVKYDSEHEKMRVENCSFNKQGNVSWTSYSSYFDDTYISDSTLLRFNGTPYHGKIEYVTKKGKKGKAWIEDNVLMVHTTGIKRTGEYDRGRINGVWDQFDKKGNKTRSTTYKRGEKYGKQEYWVTKYFNTKFKKEAAKEYGIEGKSIRYLKTTRNYFDNELDGEAKEYYWNGQQKFQGTFSLGKKNGLFKDWSLEGKPLAESGFVNDTIHGKSSKWNKYSDKIVSVTEYNMGENHGIYRQWDASGNPVISGQAVNNFKDGKWLNYYSDSLLKSKTIFHAEDSIIAQNWKDEFSVDMYKEYSYQDERERNYYGNFTELQQVGESGEYTFYFKTGEVSRTGQVKDFVRTGIWKIWDEGGT
ncbi:MAG: hypothetical protein JKY54_01830, partial [Flavobacteriales bacterium]|nr:hypothetical protein [Flavobacteriales bacterium]